MLTQAVEHLPFVFLESAGGHGLVAVEATHKPVRELVVSDFRARVAKLISFGGLVGATFTATGGGGH